MSFPALRRATAALLAALALAHASAHGADPLDDFDAFVVAQMEAWSVPGVSVAIVKDGQVVRLKGYGYRNAERGLRMTQDTVVPIASVSKSFTVASLAVLVREGKLSWDRPVREYLPDWKTKNDFATLHATPRDLVTHRVGLPRHDYSWFTSSATREELYKRVPHLEFSAELRERFQYNNFMYMTAGYLGGRIAGSTWEELVTRGLFEPLGMAASSFSIADLLRAPDHGTGYTLDDDLQPKPGPYRDLGPMGPTGSINSNARDMANYVAMYVGHGRFNGQVVLDAADVREMTTPQMVIPDARIFDEVSAQQYGMGFFLTHYRGERLAHHGGNMPGASTMLSFMPAKGLGVFVHANVSSSMLPTVIAYGAYDRLLGLKPVAWGERYLERRTKLLASEKSAKAQNLTPRKPGTRPAHDLAEYAGEYFHPGYGVIAFAAEGPELRVKYNALTATLRHYHYDVFEVPPDALDELEKVRALFVTDLNGDVSGVQVAIEPAVKPVEFTRLPDKAFKDPAFLARFAGEYELGPTKVTITLRPDHVLVMAIPGQPVRELVGLRGRRFAQKDRAGYQVDFVADAAGAIFQAAFYQPQGNYVAVRK